MPNWCHNTLIVTGPQRTLAKFEQKVRSKSEPEKQPLSFQRIRPIPKNVLENEPMAGDLSDPNAQPQGWWMWCVHNWGTKWDASFGQGSMFSFATNENAKPHANRTLTASGHELRYKFDTAWSPPVPIVEKLARDYPDLRFELQYGEPGAEYAGVFRANGLNSTDTELPIEEVLDTEDMWF